MALYGRSPKPGATFRPPSQPNGLTSNPMVLMLGNAPLLTEDGIRRAMWFPYDSTHPGFEGHDEAHGSPAESGPLRRSSLPASPVSGQGGSPPRHILPDKLTEPSRSQQRP
jgi:hypothetical protein